MYFNLPPQQLSPFLYAFETELLCGFHAPDVESSAIIHDPQRYPVASTAQRDCGHGRLGMAYHIGQQLLRHAVNRTFNFHPTTSLESNWIRYDSTAQA